MAERTAKTERLEGDRHAREELVLHVQGPAEKEREVGGRGVHGSWVGQQRSACNHV